MLLTLLPVLALAMLLLGIALSGSHRASAEAALFERLQLQLRLVLADAQTQSGDAVLFPELSSDPRLNQPESGQYAAVIDSNGSIVWQSLSLQASKHAWANIAAQFDGRRQSAEIGDLVRGQSGGNFFISRTVAFALDAIDAGQIAADDAGSLRGETLSAALTVITFDDGSSLAAQQRAYTAVLWRWLGLATTMLACLQLLLLFWSFRPLAALVEELRNVEQGRQKTFQKKYPAEIAPLTENLNSFVESERRARERYKNTLADLAHSLKTPLAALAASLQSDQDMDAMQESISRMDDIIRHQLQRARPVAGHRMSAASCAIDEVLQPLCRSLQKVYAGKGVSLSTDIPAGLQVALVREELLEVLGNVLDNAFKYCRSSVQVRLRVPAQANEARCIVLVEDDGPGIPRKAADAVIARGARLDEQLPGQGIGLSVAAELLAGCGGQLQIGQSELGGAQVALLLPFSVSGR